MKKLPNSSSSDTLTDTEILRWLCDNFEWDGYGYWLPEVCVREQENFGSEPDEPTMAEFRIIMTNIIQSRKQNE